MDPFLTNWVPYAKCRVRVADGRNVRKCHETEEITLMTKQYSQLAQCLTSENRCQRRSAFFPDMVPVGSGASGPGKYQCSVRVPFSLRADRAACACCRRRRRKYVHAPAASRVARPAITTAANQRRERGAA